MGDSEIDQFFNTGLSLQTFANPVLATGFSLFGPPGVRPRFENSGTDRFFLGAPRELQTLLPDRSFVISLPLPRASDFRTANRSRRGTRCATLPRSRDRGSSLRARRRSRPPARDGRLHPAASLAFSSRRGSLRTNRRRVRLPPPALTPASLPRARDRTERWLRPPRSSSFSSATAVPVRANVLARGERLALVAPADARFFQDLIGGVSSGSASRPSPSPPPDPAAHPAASPPNHDRRQDHVRQAPLDRRVREEVPS